MVTASSSLKLRAILRSSISRAGLGLPGGTVSGLVGAAQALFVAGMHGPRVVVVVPTDADVETMTADARFFLSGLEGRAEADVARAVVPFPSHEVDPYRGLRPHFDIATARARALHHLASGTARIVIASVAALFPRVASPDRLLAAAVALSAGDEISPQRLGEVLVDGGYRREDPVDEHGEFCVRGGVVDVFPAGEDRPVRLEFMGDTVESIRRYDPSTQRSVDALDLVSLVPLDEVPGVDPDAGGDADALDPMTVRAQVARAWLADYLQPGSHPTWLVSEYEQVARAGRAYAEQLAASHGEALAKGGTVPEPEALAIDWPSIERMIAGATRLESLGIDEPPAHPEGGARLAAHRRIPCQPALEFRGRVGDWAAEVERNREAGETVVLVAATTGRAERCIELLTEYGVPAAGPNDPASLPSSVLVTTGILLALMAGIAIKLKLFGLPS